MVDLPSEVPSPYPCHFDVSGLDVGSCTSPPYPLETSPQDATCHEWTGNQEADGPHRWAVRATARVAARLLGSWADGEAPLNEQLAGAIGGLVRSGDLRPGDRLPSERDLAEQLGVSRTTVVSAYERLRTDGIIRSRRGSGSRVAPGVEPAVGFVLGRRSALLPARSAWAPRRHRCPASGSYQRDDPTRSR